MKDNNNSLAVPNLNIPPEALEAAGEAFLELDRLPSSSFEDCITAAIRAALEAWPGMHIKLFSVGRDLLMLPLTQGPSDE